MLLRFYQPYKGASDILLDYSLSQSYVLKLWVRRACGNTPRQIYPPLSLWNSPQEYGREQNRIWILSLTCDRGLSLVFGLSGLVNGRANRPTCRAYHHTFSLLFSLIYRLPYSLVFISLITTSEWFNPLRGKGLCGTNGNLCHKDTPCWCRKWDYKPMPCYCIHWIQ